VITCQRLVQRRNAVDSASRACVLVMFFLIASSSPNSTALSHVRGFTQHFLPCRAPRRRGRPARSFQ
jgi:hypothetical protein